MPILADNKRAYYDYEIIEKYEAGLVLSGPEVKSAKSKKIDLKASYVTIDKNRQAWLINCHIAPYPPSSANQQNYDPRQTRKLLLHKKEIISLSVKLQKKGLTIMPLKLYTKNGILKIEIGLAKGKKKWNKKELIKKRETDRRIKQRMKEY